MDNTSMFAVHKLMLPGEPLPSPTMHRETITIGPFFETETCYSARITTLWCSCITTLLPEGDCGM